MTAAAADNIPSIPVAIGLEADSILAADAGLTVDQLHYRQQYRDRRIGKEVRRATVLPFIATANRDNATGQRRAVIEAYAYNRSALGYGPLAIGGYTHTDVIDLDIWLSRQSAATRDFCEALILDEERVDLAERMGVSQSTVSRWVAHLHEAIEAGESFTPERMRRMRAAA